MTARGTVFALTLSVVLHGVMFAAGDLALRHQGPIRTETPPIQAMLLPPPPLPPPARPAAESPAPASAPVQTPQAARPRPKPAQKTGPVIPAAQAPHALAADETDKPGAADEAPAGPPPAAAESDAPAQTREAAAAEPAAEPTPAATPADSWPARGGIVFRVFLGKSRFQVGESDHQWSHDGARYRMEVKVQTTGVAALIRGLRYLQRSEGEIGPQGLKPLHFAAEQEGKPPESAEFDWTGSRVSIRRDGQERRSAALGAGDQDVLSIWHQIGIIGAAGLPRTLTVASGKAAKTARLEAVGEESLRLPIGQLDTLRIQARAEDGSLTIDIWLARRYGMLPVRIRMSDGKGEELDQQAIRLHLLPITGNGPQESPAVTAAETAVTDHIELKEQNEPFITDNLYAN